MTKFEVMDKCNALDIPVGPILSMKEIAEENSLRDTGTVVEVDHPTRGKYLTVGNPIKLSDSPCEVARSPLLGEHTEEILGKVLGYSASEITEIKGSGAITPAEKGARAEAAYTPRCRSFPRKRGGDHRDHKETHWHARSRGHERKVLEELQCVSWSTASRRSARRCSRRY